MYNFSEILRSQQPTNLAYVPKTEIWIPLVLHGFFIQIARENLIDYIWQSRSIPGRNDIETLIKISMRLDEGKIMVLGCGRIIRLKTLKNLRTNAPRARA